MKKPFELPLIKAMILSEQQWRQAVKILSFLICLVLFFDSTALFSQKVDASQARQVANYWMDLVSSPHVLSEDNANVIQSDQQVLAFQFDIDPVGYVVISADQHIYPITAYSFTDSFHMEGKDNNPLADLLQMDLTNQFSHINSMRQETINSALQIWEKLITGTAEKHLLEAWPPEGTTSSGGWVETNYSQSPPYNNFCPMDLVANERSVAGCPSVAMAMIVDYTNTLNGTHFDAADAYYHNYGGNQYWIDADHAAYGFPSFDDINLYFEAISVKYNNNETINADEKAALVFGCGIAARQVYSSGGSGTFGVDQAFDAYQRFGFDNARLVADNDTSFYSQMKQNIMQAMPVHLALLQSNASGGHNVVADGYNTDGFYHINFGWGGAYNGWYHVPEELPYSLTILEGAVMDIGVRQVGGSEHQLNNFSLTVFPNPCDSYMNLRVETSFAGEVAIDLLSLFGGPVIPVFNGNILVGTHLFRLNEIPSKGCYVAVIQSSSGVVTQKIVVL